MSLSEQAAIALAGGDVRSLEEANTVEAVTADHVQAAAVTAQEAEAAAAEAERGALEGRVPAAQAAAERESARYAGLRLAVTRRRAERHAQAQRIKALAEVGEAGRRHAEALKVLHDATLADLATIRDLQAGIRDRINGWNAELASIIADGVAQGPEKPPPSGIPPGELGARVRLRSACAADCERHDAPAR